MKHEANVQIIVISTIFIIVHFVELGRKRTRVIKAA